MKQLGFDYFNIALEKCFRFDYLEIRLQASVSKLFFALANVHNFFVSFMFPEHALLSVDNSH